LPFIRVQEGAIFLPLGSKNFGDKERKKFEKA
jgi:hypothetical protein